MQRISSLLPAWDRSKPLASPGTSTTPIATITKTTTAAIPSTPSSTRFSGSALDKVFGWNRFVGLASPSTAPPQSSAVGREVYWPTSLDRECEKAARILKSFCTDGLLANESHDTSSASPIVPATPKQVLKKIPPPIIQNAAGLAIFSCMRSGLWMSGSGGSGILIARKADGTWSPPSGIILHTAELGFMLGIDIYDCVLVINSIAALEVFTRPRVALGVDIDLSVGPLLQPGLDLPTREPSKAVLTYLRARGRHQNVELDGSLVTERSNENDRFYSGNVGVLDILAGNIIRDVPEIRPLFEVIKAAEGRTDYDAIIMKRLSQQPAPSDALIEAPEASSTPMSPLSPPRSPFGIPDTDDPDPFGVIALEMAGLEIREAGTRLRPASSQFEYHPNPISPLSSKFSRQSIDTSMSQSNRGSYMSSRTHTTALTDIGMQTDRGSTPETDVSAANGSLAQKPAPTLKIAVTSETDEVDYTQVDLSAIRHLSRQPSTEDLSEPEPPRPAAAAPAVDPVVAPEQPARLSTPSAELEDDRHEDADDEDDESDLDDEEPVLYEIVTAAAPTILSTQVAQVIQAKGSIVTIPRRNPPPLPVRSPARNSRSSKTDIGDVTPLRSPVLSSAVSVNSGHSRSSTSVSLPSQDGISASDVALSVEDRVSDSRFSIDSAFELERHVLPRPASIPASEYTGLVESRWSLDSAAETPSTPQATERASSIDDSDCEPRTPRPEADLYSKQHHMSTAHKGAEEDDGMNLPAHAIEVN